MTVKILSTVGPASSEKKDIKVLELAVGRGGDLFKWIGIEAEEVVGVDIDDKSVFGKNGALHRYKRKLNQKKETVTSDTSAPFTFSFSSFLRLVFLDPPKNHHFPQKPEK